MKNKEFYHKFKNYMNIIVDSRDDFLEFFPIENHITIYISKYNSSNISVRLYENNLLINEWEKDTNNKKLKSICEFLFKNLKQESLEKILNKIQYKIIQSL